MNGINVEKTITSEWLGRAIVHFIGVEHGWVFFPYCIDGSSFVFPNEMMIKLSNMPQEDYEDANEKKEKREVSDGSIFELTKHEIFQAITRKNDFDNISKFIGNRVVRISCDLPEKVKVKLRLVNRGSVGVKNDFSLI